MSRPQTNPNSLANLRLGPKSKKPKPIAERFWAKVREGAIPPHCPELGPCLEWTAARNPAGYGILGSTNKNSLAHRVSYEIGVAPIPPGASVLHRCDNPACVRTSHLFLGDQTDNMADAHRKGRTARGEGCNKRKMTEAHVIEIRRRAAAGETRADIARAFGISRPAVVLIVQGKRWAHVSGVAK